jgi:sulfate transport system permease protein
MAQKRFSALPGFSLTLGFTLFYLSAIVLIPMAGLVIRAFELSWWDLWHLATTDRALAAYRLTFGASLVAALANAVFGGLLAWVLVRYEFPGRRIIDAIVDFPFALPTAVAGLTLANLFATNGWLGKFLVPLGVKGAYSPLGVVIALTFVGMPFVVRTLQPVLEHLDELRITLPTLSEQRRVADVLDRVTIIEGDVSDTAAVERAIMAAQPLPVPTDTDLFQESFRELTLVFRPKD